MGKIKLLSDEIINQIAAGEIVESPSFALKEVIENSIDADASTIDVFIKNGGKTKIVVEDNGEGMSLEDLNACILRHATSKLNGNNLFNINSYGFRGEALPSIASVSNFQIESNGFGISVSFSKKSNLYESSMSKGTRVCISDIFNNLPVRLKFLKSETVELEKCIKIVEDFALTKNNISFTLNSEKGQLFSISDSSIETRVRKIYGNEQVDKAIYFEDCNEKISIKGYLFHPTHSKYSSNKAQRLFINNRSVKDKIVGISTKIGYRNIIDSKRYPLSLLFIDIDPFFIDVNISPSKSKIKFRDEKGIQKFLINSITKHVEGFNKIALDFIIPSIVNSPSKNFHPKNIITPRYKPIKQSAIDMPKTSDIIHTNIEQKSEEKSLVKEEKMFFGKAVSQLFDNYIISVNGETNDIFIIDQHAVHEKIILNKIEKNLDDGNIKYLIRAEIINISNQQANRLEQYKQILNEYGFKIDIVKTDNTTFGSNALAPETVMIINAIPGIMMNSEAINFIKDLSEDSENMCRIDEYFKKRLANIACHNSIRSGRKLSMTEMDELLRQMENNKEIFQCNHHRPSFLKISKKKLESMFERN